MHTRTSLCKAILLSALVAGGASLPAPAASAASVIVVDDDGLQCPGAGHFSIQAAVGAASPGDVVQVCAGTYREAVTVSVDSLRLTTDGSGDVLLDGESVRPHGFLLQAVTGVTVEGFVVRGYGDDIALVDAHGSTIRENVVSGAKNGIVARSSNGNLIEANTAEGNTRTPNAPGIHLTAGSATNVVRENQTTGNGFGIQLSTTGAGNLIAHNVSSANGFAGISNVSTEETTIAHNTTYENTRNGIVVARPHGFYQPLNATVRHNHSFANGGSGIALVHGGGNDVAHNLLWGNGGDGISLHESMDNLIERNHGDGNAIDGVGIKDHPGNPLSAGNVVRHNQLRDNAEHDCHDDTIGPRSAGTNNTWDHNHAGTENVAGLCSSR